MAYAYDFGQAMKMTLQEQLAAVTARQIPPRWIVGTGYKDGRKVAIDWLNEMIAKEGEGKMGTCMGCLKDFEEGDLVWQHGLLCADCREGDSNDRDL